MFYGSGSGPALEERMPDFSTLLMYDTTKSTAENARRLQVAGHYSIKARAAVYANGSGATDLSVQDLFWKNMILHAHDFAARTLSENCEDMYVCIIEMLASVDTIGTATLDEQEDFAFRFSSEYRSYARMQQEMLNPLNKTPSVVHAFGREYRRLIKKHA